MIDHVCINERTTKTKTNEKQRENRIYSIVKQKKKSSGFVYFQVTVEISICLYWKPVTHTQ